MHAIKDSNILSGGAGLAMVYLMLLAAAGTGGLHIPAVMGAHVWLYVLAGSVPLILCAVLVLGHRKLTALSRRQIAATFAIHFSRAALVLAVEFGLWELVRRAALGRGVPAIRGAAAGGDAAAAGPQQGSDLCRRRHRRRGPGQGGGDAGRHRAGDPGGGRSGAGGQVAAITWLLAPRRNGSVMSRLARYAAVLDFAGGGGPAAGRACSGACRRPMAGTMTALRRAISSPPWR